MWSAPITEKGVLSPTPSPHIWHFGGLDSFQKEAGLESLTNLPRMFDGWLHSVKGMRSLGILSDTCWAKVIVWHPPQPPISRVRAGSPPATLNVRDICPSGTCMLTLNLTDRAQGPFGPVCRHFVVGQSMNCGPWTKERPHRLTQALLPRRGMSGGHRALVVLSLSTKREFCGKLRHRPCFLWGRLGKLHKVWLTLPHLCPFNQSWWPLYVNWPC